MKSKKIINGNCWVAYFDILGFKNLLTDFIAQYETKEEVPAAMDAFVDVYYEDILRKLVAKGKYSPDKVSIHWFSDSFFLYTVDDSSQSLCCIEQSASHFFIDVIWTRTALRGALSVGAFYADKEKGVFLGPALIDAYQYAEKQHWIGLIVTPKACSELQNINLCPPDRGKYIKYDVPVKPVGKTESLWAYTFGRHPCILKSVEEMKKEAENKGCGETVIRKYENTLSFLKVTKTIRC